MGNGLKANCKKPIGKKSDWRRTEITNQGSNKCQFTRRGPGYQRGDTGRVRDSFVKGKRSKNRGRKRESMLQS